MPGGDVPYLVTDRRNASQDDILDCIQRDIGATHRLGQHDGGQIHRRVGP